MTQLRSLRSALLLGIMLALPLSGCVVAPAPYDVGATVRVGPPAPIVETVGVAPYPGYVWLGGYWNWTGERHVWVPGRWEAPRRGYHWVPHRWVQAGGGWRMAQGHWERGQRER